MGGERLCHGLFQLAVVVPVPVKQTVEAYGVGRCHQRAHGDFAVEGARSANTHQVECAVAGVDGAMCEVDVGGGIEFGHDDVDVVATHPGTQRSEALSVVAACEGMNFAVYAFELNVFENVFEHVDARGVAHQDDVVGQFASGHINVVKAPVGSQYQFAGFEILHFTVLILCFTQFWGGLSATVGARCWASGACASVAGI